MPNILGKKTVASCSLGVTVQILYIYIKSTVTVKLWMFSFILCSITPNRSIEISKLAQYITMGNAQILSLQLFLAKSGWSKISQMYLGLKCVVFVRLTKNWAWLTDYTEIPPTETFHENMPSCSHIVPYGQKCRCKHPLSTIVSQLNLQRITTLLGEYMNRTQR
jgi:hypothetical protein